MTIYYLYIKTHKTSGLKYLGQTSKQDPYTYCGSGKDWVAHLKDYGFDVDTEILITCNSKKELNTYGKYYSILYKITTSVDNYGSRIWANRIPETGGGGVPTETTIKKLREAQTGKKKPNRNPEHTEKIAKILRGRSNPKTANGLKKWYKSNPDRSDAITKQSNSLKEWYRSNPDKSHDKAEKSCDSRVLNDYLRLNIVHQMILNGLSNTEIQSKIKIDYATIRKLRNGSHRFFRVLK